MHKSWLLFYLLWFIKSFIQFEVMARGLFPLRPWINRTTLLNYPLIRSCKMSFINLQNIFLKICGTTKVKKARFLSFFQWTFWKKLQGSSTIIVNCKHFCEIFTQTKLIDDLYLFCCIFQIFRKIIPKIKKLSNMNFYKKLVTWSGWSMAVKKISEIWITLSQV